MRRWILAVVALGISLAARGSPGCEEVRQGFELVAAVPYVQLKPHPHWPQESRCKQGSLPPSAAATHNQHGSPSRRRRRRPPPSAPSAGRRRSHGRTRRGTCQTGGCREQMHASQMGCPIHRNTHLQQSLHAQQPSRPVPPLRTCCVPAWAAAPGCGGTGGNGASAQPRRVEALLPAAAAAAAAALAAPPGLPALKWRAVPAAVLVAGGPPALR